MLFLELVMLPISAEDPPNIQQNSLRNPQRNLLKEVHLTACAYKFKSKLSTVSFLGLARTVPTSLLVLINSRAS